MKKKIAIHWFRFDLRVSDNPSLNYLSKNYDNIVGIYIFDDINSDPKLGSASKVWLHASLDYLNKQLDGNLIFLKGDAKGCIDQLMDSFDVEEISWNRSYEPWIVKRDKSLKMYLKSKVNVNSFNGSLLWEPWEVLKNDGTPYKVFTPFYKRGCLSAREPRVPKSEKINFFKHNFCSLNLSDLKLLENKKWESKILSQWDVGEDTSLEIMKSFYLNGVKDYADGRNFPIKKNVSRLSPYLHWGQISPNILWYELQSLKNVRENDIEVFKSELGWREFAYYLLYHFPQLQKKNLKSNFDNFQWLDDQVNFKKWSKGLTGIPIVDAGMRELWETGWMHNRIRMVVGSFLVKHLRINWQEGEKHFRNCLLDFNEANNVAQWQWVAGCGADAAPYFRIFNPIIQGEKFDKEGLYVKKWVPELSKVPPKFIHKPWEMDLKYQQEINTFIGKDYPNPIVIHEKARALALSAFQSLKTN